MIIKRGKRYGVRIYRAGKQEWLGTFPTRKEAKAVERRELERPQAAHDETCDSFAGRWVSDFPRPRASTDRSNHYAAKRFAEDFTGKKMSAVTRREAREWASQHRSPARVVRAMFNDALNEEVVTSNPFANLRLEQSRGRKDIEALTEDELHELADTALGVLGNYGPTFRACILFAAYVGLRPSEMFVLKWSDITDRTVRIKASLGNTGEVTLPKNNRARTVILPPPAREALRSMPRRADSPYVFTTTRGKRFSKSSHYYYWRAVQLAAGRAGMDFYELRHFCATHLLEMGVRHSDVAVQLGHTDGGALVMDTYGHPSEDAARDRMLDAFEAQGGRLRLIKPQPDDDDDTGAAAIDA